jgi:MFS family permease
MPPLEELIDPRGRPISQRDIFVAMGINTLAASFGTVWLAMTYTMPLVMFMQAIGASGLVIGLVTTVRYIAVSAQIPAALASENLLERKPFWSRFALTHRLLWFVIAAMACWCGPSKWWLPMAIIAVVGASEALGNASSAPWLSWMADLIPLRIAGRFWGLRQSISTATSLAGLLLAGQILDATRDPVTGQAQPRGFAIVFGIAACLGVADIVTHHFVREPRPVPTPAGGALHRRIMAPLADRDFRLLTLCLGIWNFGLSMTTAFALVYLKRDFGVTYSQLAALSIAAALGAIISGYGFGDLMDRIGARLLGAILFLATPLSLVFWLFVNRTVIRIGPFLFPQSIALLCLAGILGGAISSAVCLVQFRLASELTAPRGRTMAMAVHWSFVGILSALGPTVGGLIMDHFPSPQQLDLVIPSGLPFSFYHAQLVLFTLLSWCVALPLLMAIRAPANGNAPLPVVPGDPHLGRPSVTGE